VGGLAVAVVVRSVVYVWSTDSASMIGAMPGAFLVYFTPAPMPIHVSRRMTANSARNPISKTSHRSFGL
jgi:hypothetical protein